MDNLGEEMFTSHVIFTFEGTIPGDNWGKDFIGNHFRNLIFEFK